MERGERLSQQLKMLGTQLIRIASEMAASEQVGDKKSIFSRFGQKKSAWLDAAEAACRERAERHDFFPSDFFGEPAWNILLDLFIVDLKGQRISVQDACLSSGVPPTTALRYVGQLEEGSFVKRVPDATDARRTFLVITTKGQSLMRRYLARTNTELERQLVLADMETALIKLDDGQNPT